MTAKRALLRRAVRRLTSRIGRLRSIQLVDRIEPYIDDDSKVLDIGPGGGWISEELQRRKGALPTLVDITDFGQTKLPVDLYDGENLPYPDDSFDTCLLIYTLHHCSQPLRVLGEAKRVSKSRLIIIEDTPHSAPSRVLAVLRDMVWNVPTLLIPPGMNMALNFRHRDGWRRVFAELRLEVVVEEPFALEKRVHKALFVVENAPHGRGGNP